MHTGGVKLYADRPAFAALVRELERLVSAPRGEHFEFQTLEWEGVDGFDIRSYDGEDFASLDDLQPLAKDTIDVNFMVLEEEDFDRYPEEAEGSAIKRS